MFYRRGAWRLPSSKNSGNLLRTIGLSHRRGHARAPRYIVGLDLGLPAAPDVLAPCSSRRAAAQLPSGEHASLHRARHSRTAALRPSAAPVLLRHAALNYWPRPLVADPAAPDGTLALPRERGLRARSLVFVKYEKGPTRPTLKDAARSSPEDNVPELDRLALRRWSSAQRPETDANATHLRSSIITGLEARNLTPRSTASTSSPHHLRLNCGGRSQPGRRTRNLERLIQDTDGRPLELCSC